MGYSEDVALILKETRFSMPFDLQAALFLSTVWKSLPRHGIVGLAADTKYQDKNDPEGDWKSTLDLNWGYSDDRDNPAFYDKMVAWAYAKNQNSANGAGSVFWHYASRLEKVLERYRARGSYHELIAVSAVAADIDLVDNGQGLLEVWELVKQAPIQPTFSLASGGGLQLVWVLNEPYIITDSLTAKQYKEDARSFLYGLFGHSELFKYFDLKVCEPSRMLRLPGFINQKTKRNGAVAQLLQHNITALYTITQIKSHCKPIPNKWAEKRADGSLVGTTAAYKPNQDGVYAVEEFFHKYIVLGEVPEQGIRHNTRLRLALSAAKSKIPYDQAFTLIEAATQKWGSAGSDNEALTRNVLDWAYEHIEDNEVLHGAIYGIKLGNDAATPITAPEIAEKSSGKDRLPEGVIPIEYPSANLPEVRRQHSTMVRNWIREIDSPDRMIPTLHIDQAAPGTGKTTDVIKALIERAQEAIALGLKPDDPGAGKYKSLFARYFKMTRADLPKFLDELKINIHEYPRNMFGVFEARSDDAEKAGHCQNFDRASRLGAKGYNVVARLCESHCPLLAQCKETGYLSQFDRLKHYWIVFCSHQHGFMQENLIDDRKLIVFDESVDKTVLARTVVEQKHLEIYNIEKAVLDQYGTEVELVKQFLETCRLALGENHDKPKSERSKVEIETYAKLGGHWFMSYVVQKMGKEAVERLITITNSTVSRLNNVDVSTPATISDANPNYLNDLLAIFRYEYEECYRNRTNPDARWNSRIIPYAHTLLIFPCTPFSFTGNSAVIALDATSRPEYYRAYFGDMHTQKDENTGKRLSRPKPRAIDVFDLQLSQRATIVQYHDADLTRRKMYSELKNPKLRQKQFTNRAGQWTIRDTYQLVRELRREYKAYELATLILNIHRLADKHKKSLLVVLYKGMWIESEDQNADAIYAILLKWIQASGVLPIENIQWYGNLRGKNDWKELEAVLTVGTPRLPPDELQIQAQIQHWLDEEPLDFTPKLVQEPYSGYRDSEGYYYGYWIKSYADPRMHTFYIHSIASEIRQCGDRIRFNASDDKFLKAVYIGTGVPCMQSISVFDNWSTVSIDHQAHQVMQDAYDEYLETQTNVYVPDVIHDLENQADCSYTTATKYVTAEYTDGFEDASKKKWSEVLPLRFIGEHKMLGDETEKPPVKKNTKTGKVETWLHDVKTQYPNRTPTQLYDIYVSLHPDTDIGRSTFYRVSAKFS